MAGSETPPLLDELEQRVAAAVERAVEGLREQILERLRAHHAESERLVAGVEAPRPDAFLDAAELAPLLAPPPEPEPPAATEPGDTERLLDALRRLDRASTQGEVMDALLDTAQGFASRVALFLTRRDGVRGWSGRGFGGAAPAPDTTAAWHEPPWDRLAAARGPVHLSAGECAPLASRLDAPLPQEGAFVLLVIRDRMGAALYADRVEEGSLDLPALQLLTYAAAQVIETLPFRSRPSTPTLGAAGEVSHEQAALEPWDSAALGPPLAAAPEAEAMAGTGAVETAEEVWTLEDAPPLPEPEEPGRSASLDGTPVEAPPVYEETAGTAEPVAWEPDAAPAATPETRTPGAAAAETMEAPAAEPEEAGPEGPSAGATQPLDLSEDQTVTTHRGTAEREAPETAPPAARRLSGSPEVVPPPDLEGPGWAFSTHRIPTHTGDEAVHEEARRLARLLVSEIKLYNEEEVDEGRRRGDLYERLKEDIERSRQMYEDRVDERAKSGPDYFREELVRILAGGDATALGL